MKKNLLSLIFFLLLFNELSAKYVQTCKVRYKKDYGWSDYYTVEVSFLSGSELNNATRSYEYDSFSTYAVVFWGDGEASVIQLSNLVGCGMEVKQSCITYAPFNLEGDDQNGRGWEVCTKGYCY